MGCWFHTDLTVPLPYVFPVRSTADSTAVSKKALWMNEFEADAIVAPDNTFYLEHHMMIYHHWLKEPAVVRSKGSLVKHQATISVI